jgi:hypothetical protein
MLRLRCTGAEGCSSVGDSLQLNVALLVLLTHGLV